MAQVKAARAEMDSDARQAALLAERMSEAARAAVEADLTERHAEAMQRVMEKAAKTPLDGGEAGGAGGAAPERGGSGGDSGGRA